MSGTVSFFVPNSGYSLFERILMHPLYGNFVLSDGNCILPPWQTQLYNTEKGLTANLIHCADGTKVEIHKEK